MKDHLNVRLFGGMYIEGLGGQMTIETLRSPMLAKLLVYLLCHHKDQCSVQEMVEALWPDESSDNPAGALKNLVYRLRKILSTIWPEYDLVITGKGYYSWNPEIPIVMDTEVFEDLKQQSLSEKDPDKLISICTQMTELYKGRMFAGFDDTYWIASLGTYYFSAYEDSVIKLSKLLDGMDRFEDMEQVLKAALEEDPLNEELHYWMIKALYGQKKYNRALEHYQKASNIIYDNLGIRLSEKTQELYKTLMVQLHDTESDILAVSDYLRKDNDQGVFFCEYGVFKQIYQLQIHRTSRLGYSSYLGMVTIVPETDTAKDSQEYTAAVKNAAGKLKKAMQVSLRSGDVITRYSETQFLILLPTCQYESTKIIVDRLRAKFYTGRSRYRVRLEFDFDEIV